MSFSFNIGGVSGGNRDNRFEHDNHHNRHRNAKKLGPTGTIVMGLIFTLVCGFFFAMTMNSHNQYNALFSNGVKTQGEISNVAYQTKTNSNSSSSSSTARSSTTHEISTVIYDAANREYAIEDKRKDSGLRRQIGDTLTVYYDKADPAKAVVEGSQESSPLGMGISGLMALVGLGLTGSGIAAKIRGPKNDQGNDGVAESV